MSDRIQEEEDSQASLSDHQADTGCEKSQQAAFGQELANEATAPRTQRDAIEDLELATRTLHSTLALHPDPRSCRLTHPYFGRLPLITALRLLTLHTRHHLAQFPRRPAEG